MGVLGLLFCSLLLAGLCKGDDARVAAWPPQLSAPRRAGVAAGAGAGLHPPQHRGGAQPHQEQPKERGLIWNSNLKSNGYQDTDFFHHHSIPILWSVF